MDHLQQPKTIELQVQGYQLNFTVNMQPDPNNNNLNASTDEVRKSDTNSSFNSDTDEDTSPPSAITEEQQLLNNLRSILTSAYPHKAEVISNFNEIELINKTTEYIQYMQYVVCYQNYLAACYS